MRYRDLRHQQRLGGVSRRRIRADDYSRAGGSTDHVARGRPLSRGRSDEGRPRARRRAAGEPQSHRGAEGRPRLDVPRRRPAQARLPYGRATARRLRRRHPARAQRDRSRAARRPTRRCSLCSSTTFCRTSRSRSDKAAGTISHDFARFHPVVAAMLREVLDLQYRGDKAATDAFIERYAVWRTTTCTASSARRCSPPRSTSGGSSTTRRWEIEGAADADRDRRPRPDGRQYRAAADARRASMRRSRRELEETLAPGAKGRPRPSPCRPGQAADGAAYRCA